MSITKVPGGPTPVGVAMMRGMAEQQKGSNYRYTWMTNPGDPKARTEFPSVQIGGDSYDDTMSLKRAAVRNQGVWNVPYTKEDEAYLLRRRDQIEKAEYDTWLQKKYNLADPAQNLMLQQIAPEAFARRAELIQQQANLAAKYAMLRLRGAQNEEDLMFEWMVETKRIELPAGPIWDPLQWRERQYEASPVTTQAGVPNAYNVVGAEQAWNINRFNRGLFNPLKAVTSDNAGWNRDIQNPFDIRGNSNSKQDQEIAFYYDRANAYGWEAPLDPFNDRIMGQANGAPYADFNARARAIAARPNI